MIFRGRSLALAVALAALAAPVRAPAQESLLTDHCLTLSTDDSRRFCNLVGQTVVAAHAPIGLSATGVNPVPGTASTLGMRIGRVPRLSVAGRVGAVAFDLPQIVDRSSTDHLSFLVPTLSLDMAMGLFGGVSPAPTIGGVASLDALAHVGLVSLPGGDGFDGGLLLGWGLGARVGLARESFTLPGASVSAMYHRVGDVNFGDPALVASEGYFASDLSVWNLRAALSKRIFFVSVTAGLGYDRYVSDTEFGLDTGGAFRTFRVEGLEVNRTSTFLNAQWTMLVIHLVAEVGWQSGSDFPAALPVGAGVEGGSLFGGLAVRLSI